MLGTESEEPTAEVALHRPRFETKLGSALSPIFSQWMIFGHVRLDDITADGDATRNPVLKEPPFRLHDDVDIEVINSSCTGGMGAEHRQHESRFMVREVPRELDLH